MIVPGKSEGESRVLGPVGDQEGAPGPALAAAALESEAEDRKAPPCLFFFLYLCPLSPVSLPFK